MRFAIGPRPGPRHHGLGRALWSCAAALLAMSVAAMVPLGWPIGATAKNAEPASDAPYARVAGDHGITLPGDYGSHPDFRTEWWYITGWLTTRGGESLGFQVTFFRTRLELQGDNPSAFAPRQLIIAHAAISDPRRGRLWQDQRIERAGFGLAEAGVAETDVHLGTWSLVRSTGHYRTRVPGTEFSSSDTAQLAMSRASMTWMGSSAPPGASTSPPRAMRLTHHGNLPLWSCGPSLGFVSST